MKHTRVFIAIILFALVSGAVLASAQDSSPGVTLDRSQVYLIGESDVLAINVWHEPELSRVMPVRTDGKITLPLIGELQASGKTVDELRTTIATELKKFLEAPEVTRPAIAAFAARVLGG